MIIMNIIVGVADANNLLTVTVALPDVPHVRDLKAESDGNNFAEDRSLHFSVTGYP